MSANITIRVPDWLDRIVAWPLLAYRKHKYGLPFRKIPLGDSFFSIVSPEDFYWLNKFHWSRKKSQSNFYAVRILNDGCKESKLFSMHREIMNPPKGFLVDHKNLNSLDNTRTNLRLATRSQNMFNRKKIKTATSSRFIGVCFYKRTKKWCAYIRIGGKLIWLGSFDNEIDAAKAYDAAAKKYHGEFARLNFPERSEGPRAEQLRRITHGNLY